VIVRGADTGRPELAPQAAGLFAVSLGLSALFADDHEMKEWSSMTRSTSGADRARAKCIPGRPIWRLNVERAECQFEGGDHDRQDAPSSCHPDNRVSVPAYAEEKFEKLKAQQIRTRGHRRRSLV
jgi:hypothetical protein